MTIATTVLVLLVDARPADDEVALAEAVTRLSQARAEDAEGTEKTGRDAPATITT